MIELPPIKADLFRLVDRADQQSNSNREQLDFGQRDLDVARHDEALVEDPIENVDQACRSVPLRQWRRHKVAILRNLSARLSTAGRGRAYLSNGDATGALANLVWNVSRVHRR